MSIVKNPSSHSTVTSAFARSAKAIFPELYATKFMRTKMALAAHSGDDPIDEAGIAGASSQETEPATARAASAPLANGAPTINNDQNAWEELKTTWLNCTRCGLHQGRNQVVFGRGALARAKLFVVLDAPDSLEDRAGEPAQGASGELLRKMLLAMNLGLDQVFLSNIVRCRTPHSRLPRPDEVDSCRGLLEAQVALVQPEKILGLGSGAAQALLRVEASLDHIHGERGEFQGIPLVVTWSPQDLLENTVRKREAWQDLQKLMRIS